MFYNIVNIFTNHKLFFTKERQNNTNMRAAMKT